MGDGARLDFLDDLFETPFSLSSLKVSSSSSVRSTTFLPFDVFTPTIGENTGVKIPEFDCEFFDCSRGVGPLNRFGVSSWSSISVSTDFDVSDSDVFDCSALSVTVLDCSSVALEKSKVLAEGTWVADTCTGCLSDRIVCVGVSVVDAFLIDTTTGFRDGVATFSTGTSTTSLFDVGFVWAGAVILTTEYVSTCLGKSVTVFCRASLSLSSDFFFFLDFEFDDDSSELDWIEIKLWLEIFATASADLDFWDGALLGGKGLK